MEDVCGGECEMEDIVEVSARCRTLVEEGAWEMDDLSGGEWGM